MSAGQLPNFWDSNSREIIFGVGGGAVGGSQIYHQHNEKILEFERTVHLIRTNTLCALQRMVFALVR